MKKTLGANDRGKFFFMVNQMMVNGHLFCFSTFIKTKVAFMSLKQINLALETFFKTIT